jgi:hypothetical protein
LELIVYHTPASTRSGGTLRQFSSKTYLWVRFLEKN